MDSGGQVGSFINKPPRGWLHPDHQLSEEGVCYAVRYIGALEVNTSMKSLNFDTRSLIAKECISKVCEAAGLKTVDKKKKPVKSIGRIIGNAPMMAHAGSDVTLRITASSLSLTTVLDNVLVVSHHMPNISFASGGDPDTLDFIAYVARDPRVGRACYVLECGIGGSAQDVITTIGQAFELRFKQYLKKSTNNSQYMNVNNTQESTDAAKIENSNLMGTIFSNKSAEVPNNMSNILNIKEDRDYYNDLPGKVPPDLVQRPDLSKDTLRKPESISGISNDIRSNENKTLFKNNLNANVNVKGLDNLIDLGDTCSKKTYGINHFSQKCEPAYANDIAIKQNQRDPFDMQPFSMQLTQMKAKVASPTSKFNSSNIASNQSMPNQLNQVGKNQSHMGTNVQKINVNVPLGPSSASSTHSNFGATNNPQNNLQKQQLQNEAWFHGPISRKEAEFLLKNDGDFLVRECQGDSSQFVLTGLQNGIKKHLLLVDPKGVVRTKSRTFDSVSHLINFHRDNQLPIVSAESALLLSNPVKRNSQ